MNNSSSYPSSHSGVRLCRKVRMPPTAVGGYFRSFLQMTPSLTSGALARAALSGRLRSRKDLNHPPTAVGGIHMYPSVISVERI